MSDTSFTSRGALASQRARDGKLERYTFVDPFGGKAPSFNEPTDEIAFLRNVTKNTPLHVVAGDVRRIPVTSAEGKVIGETIKKETKLVLPDQVIAMQAQHWPEIKAMLEKYARDGLRYFVVSIDGSEESAEDLYARLAKADPQRAHALESKLAKARSGEE